MDNNFGLHRDPIEGTLEFRKYEKRVDLALQFLYPDAEWELGICHTIWRIKKMLLKECYDIDWRTPAEMNPGVCFD